MEVLYNYNNNTQYNRHDSLSDVEITYDLYKLFDNCTYEILMFFVNKYKLLEDKVTNIYSYYEYVDSNYTINIIVLDKNYVYNVCSTDENGIFAYEINIDIGNEKLFSKTIVINKNYIEYNKFKENETIHYRNEKNIFMLNALKKKYIDNFDNTIKLFVHDICDSDTYFTYSSYKNLKVFISHNASIFIDNQRLLIKKNTDMYYIDNITNIKNDNVYNMKELSYNTYTISYTRYKYNVMKQIYCDGELKFDSELCLDGFKHSIIKLYNKFSENDIKMKNHNLPYFLFDSNIDKNILTVYAYNKPDSFTYTINIINKTEEPIQTVYKIDNNGDLYYFEECSLSSYENGYYIDNQYIAVNTKNFDTYIVESDTPKNINKTTLEAINSLKKNIMENRFGRIDDEFYNTNEIVYKESNNVYKFIINCGITQSKNVENIAIVVETGATTQDISKIIIKKDGNVDIIRTNNNNQLIIKSATRNKFEGNIGYKFAVSNNIPCVVSLEIPDDSEVVFDHYHNKFRCNKCIVKDIRPIKERNVKEISNTCGICMMEIPNIMFYPCLHVGCSACITNYEPSNTDCYICKQKIESYTILKEYSVNNSSIDKANSAIYCTDFEYKIGETLLVDNFNISEYWKCSTGIHFHNKIEDVYNWLEFIDIPDELKINNNNINTEINTEVNNNLDNPFKKIKID